MIVFPQRPKLITPSLLPRFSSNEFIAQPKLNGDRCLVCSDNKGNLTFWNRHGEQFARFRPTREMLNLLKLPPETVLDAELLHFRHKGYKNKLAIFDVICVEGEFLDTWKQVERWRKLYDLLPYLPFRFWPSRGQTPEVFLLANSRSPVMLFETVKQWAKRLPILEGIVIKHTESPLRFGFKRCPASEGWYKVRLAKSGLYIV